MHTHRRQHNKKTCLRIAIETRSRIYTTNIASCLVADICAMRMQMRQRTHSYAGAGAPRAHTRVHPIITYVHCVNDRCGVRAQSCYLRTLINTLFEWRYIFKCTHTHAAWRLRAVGRGDGDGGDAQRPQRRRESVLECGRQSPPPLATPPLSLGARQSSHTRSRSGHVKTG